MITLLYILVSLLAVVTVGSVLGAFGFLFYCLNSDMFEYKQKIKLSRGWDKNETE